MKTFKGKQCCSMRLEIELPTRDVLKGITVQVSIYT